MSFGAGWFVQVEHLGADPDDTHRNVDGGDDDEKGYLEDQGFSPRGHDEGDAVGDDLGK